MKPSKISQIKPNEYIRRKPDSKKTYIKNTYSKSMKAYSCVDFDDINNKIFIKSNTIVFIDFTF